MKIHMQLCWRQRTTVLWKAIFFRYTLFPDKNPHGTGFLKARKQKR